MIDMNLHKKSLEIAKKLILDEASALSILGEGLGDSFRNSLKMIIECQGHTVITGMGKSGHIGRKIAATLASTGTPSFFIHPAEASHGDLGMLGKNDVLIAISNSGDTPELNDILRFSADNGIPIIAITKNTSSLLAKLSTIYIALPDIPEAAPLNFVPTSSTTMTLALGDALAISLMFLRRITYNDFNRYHPGGILGKKLKLVNDIMCTGSDMPLVNIDTKCDDILNEMTKKGFGCTGVLDKEKKLVGIVTDGDLRRHIGNCMLMLTAKELMTYNPYVVDESCIVEKAKYLMQQKKITSLFVVNNKIPIGIINIHMLANA